MNPLTINTIIAINPNAPTMGEVIARLKLERATVALARALDRLNKWSSIFGNRSAYTIEMNRRFELALRERDRLAAIVSVLAARRRGAC